MEEIGEDFVCLSWIPPESDGGSPITGYILERCDISGKSWLPVNKQPIKETTYKATGLKRDLTYEFRVRAENAIGQSEPSPSSEPFICGHKIGKAYFSHSDVT